MRCLGWGGNGEAVSPSRVPSPSFCVKWLVFAFSQDCCESVAGATANPGPELALCHPGALLLRHGLCLHPPQLTACTGRATYSNLKKKLDFLLAVFLSLCSLSRFFPFSLVLSFFHFLSFSCSFTPPLSLSLFSLSAPRHSLSFSYIFLSFSSSLHSRSLRTPPLSMCYTRMAVLGCVIIHYRPISMEAYPVEVQTVLCMLIGEFTGIARPLVTNGRRTDSSFS